MRRRDDLKRASIKGPVTLQHNDVDMLVSTARCVHQDVAYTHLYVQSSRKEKSLASLELLRGEKEVPCS